MLVISALARLRQEGHKFKVSLVHSSVLYDNHKGDKLERSKHPVVPYNLRTANLFEVFWYPYSQAWPMVSGLKTQKTSPAWLQ